VRKVDWERIGPLPRVNPWHRGQRSLTWAERRDAYRDLPKRGLVISAEMVTPVVHAEAGRTHLDSILSVAALLTHPVASAYDGQICCVPLPVELVWVSPGGQPLWACAPLVSAQSGMVCWEYCV